MDTRRSTSGIAIMIGSALVIWKSKIQKTVAHSTMEAEFKALASAVSLSTWANNLLCELNCDTGTITFLCDNQGCIKALQGHNYKGRSKHNEIHFHIVKERITENHIFIQYVQMKMCQIYLISLLIKLNSN